MSGVELRKKLNDAGYGLCDLARKLGMTTEQNLYSLLRTDSVRSGLIEDIAKIIDKPISWFYNEESSMQSVSAANSSVAVNGDNNNIATISERFIKLLEQKDKQIDTLLEMLNNKQIDD